MPGTLLRALHVLIIKSSQPSETGIIFTSIFRWELKHRERKTILSQGNSMRERTHLWGSGAYLWTVGGSSLERHGEVTSSDLLLGEWQHGREVRVWRTRQVIRSMLWSLQKVRFPSKLQPPHDLSISPPPPGASPGKGAELSPLSCEHQNLTYNSPSSPPPHSSP